MPAGQKLEYEFSCSEDLEERLSFDAAVQIQIYRIVQEAISNVCRHAGATRVWMSVSLSEGNFVVRLEDNGQGIDWTGKRTSAGRGLNNIRSRASLIDAEVESSARAAGGSVFEVRKKV
jgi:signal transduction histidine kinase